MRKLVFKLKNLPGLSKNLEITTHYSTRMMIHGDRANVMEVKGDDQLSDAQLQDWYLSRYTQFGLLCTVMNAEVHKVNSQPVEQKLVQDTFQTESEEKAHITESIVSGESALVRETSEGVTEDVLSEEVTKDVLSEEVAEEVTNDVVSEEAVPEEPEKRILVDLMSYPDLIKYAKDHGIEVKGRGKADYVAAIKTWIASQFE